VSTYTASVRVDGGTLHTSRPLTAPPKVADMIDSLVYDMSQSDGPTAAGVTSVELTVQTSGQSDTPIGDSAQGTTSTPLPPDPDLDGPLPDTGEHAAPDVEPPDDVVTPAAVPAS
jgi:hypothetical protein